MITTRQIQLVESEMLRHAAMASLDTERTDEHIEVSSALCLAVEVMLRVQNNVLKNGVDISEEL